MLLILAISLYTSRIVLSTLGVTDFGLYNVIGSVVAMFSFINAAMGNASQRFIVYALGEGDLNYQKAVFKTSKLIHCIVATIVVFLAETIGLWYLNNKMVIPVDRLGAVSWIYQFSIVACFITITNIPYNSLIIAHEKMGAFAIITIIDAILKLGIAYTIQYISSDRLISYGFLFMLVFVVDRVLYYVYCRKFFQETQYIKLKSIDKKIIKEISCFAGWSLIGNLAWIGYTQGLNLLLNLFFGPIVNAARGIVVQVQGAVSNFTKSFQTAINPQIVKSYAQNDYEREKMLIYASSKYSYFLLLCLLLPIFVEADFILELWLIEVPDYTVNFLRLTLLVMLVGPFENPVDQAIQATGIIKIYQICEGGLLLLIVPISYMMLNMGFKAEIVFVVQFVDFIIVQIVRIVIIRKHIFLPIKEYFVSVLWRPILVSVIAVGLSCAAYVLVPRNTCNNLILCFVMAVIVVLVVFVFGLNHKERKQIICRVLKMK